MIIYTVVDGSLFNEMITCGADNLKLHTDEVNGLNVFPVPDGDTGDNMYMTISSGVSAMNKTDKDDIGDVAAALSRGMLLGARGNSGVILSQFFSGVAKRLENIYEADVNLLSEAFKSGVKQAYRAVMNPTEGTILTVAREGIENAVESITPETTVNALFAKIKTEMAESLKRTPELLEVLKEAGVIDSGGAGLLCIFDGIDRMLSGDKVKNTDKEEKKEVAKGELAIDTFTEDSIMTFGYCTEFLLRLQNSKVDVSTFEVDTIIDYLKTVGDSLVVVKEDSIVKIHVHTFTPEKVIAFCRKFGEFLTVKIENMSVQHSEMLKEGEEEHTQNHEAMPQKEYAVIAVCTGKGMKNAFIDLGTDVVIEGGQTSNPSTEDFINAFRKVNAKHIFVLPNNSNIIMAANQAAEMFDSSEVHVIESRNIGSGYVALASFNPEADSAEEIAAAMNEAMQSVSTGFVSTSARDADIGGVHIRKGDYICFVGKKMISADRAKNISMKKLIDYIFDAGDKFMLTAFLGKDTDETDKDELKAYMNEKYPDTELYITAGGQDVYPYIIIAE